MVFVMFYPSIARDAIISPMPSLTDVFGVAMLLIGIVALGGAVSLWIYLQNHFYMTNESVIQEIQGSLFYRHEQTVSLGSIEDASFRQSGVIQTLSIMARFVSAPRVKKRHIYSILWQIHASKLR